MSVLSNVDNTHICIYTVRVHLTMCFRATAGALVSQVKRRARATASARALDRATVRVIGIRINSKTKFLVKQNFYLPQNNQYIFNIDIHL